MDFLWVVLGIAVVATALYFAATLLFGPGEPPEPAGEALASPLPEERELTADDLRAAVLPVTARGYRMQDVDALVERMAQQLDRAEAVGASQESGGPKPPAPAEDEAGSSTATEHAPKHQA
jgi:DivIVA domain-containing protein